MLVRICVEVFGITKSFATESCTFTYATEPLSGTDLCSYCGKLHMGWHFPIADHSYWWPSEGTYISFYNLACLY